MKHIHLLQTHRVLPREVTHLDQFQIQGLRMVIENRCLVPAEAVEEETASAITIEKEDHIDVKALLSGEKMKALLFLLIASLPRRGLIIKRRLRELRSSSLEIKVMYPDSEVVFVPLARVSGARKRRINKIWPVFPKEWRESVIKHICMLCCIWERREASLWVR